jgi:peptide/nickel transport system ATP-binding protein
MARLQATVGHDKANGGGGPLLSVSDLSTVLRRTDGPLPLIEEVSFELAAGRTVGLVGESGSGKSLTAMSIIGLLPPTLEITGGKVLFSGIDLTALSQAELRKIRGRDIGMIFQDPQNSLDPCFTVGAQMVETIRTHTDLSSRAAGELAVSLLDRVGIRQPAQRAQDYPHQLSGGMAQRVMIAMAISCQPRLLIADEPTTALDVTVQAQILTLLRELQHEMDMALLLISHDLSVIAEMADDVAVLYAGHVVERGEVTATFAAPSHPYTEALLGARPTASTRGEPLVTIPGVVPSPFAMPSGCHFHPRCSYAHPECREHRPAFEITASRSGKGTRCLRHAELDLSGVRATAPVSAPPERPPNDDTHADRPVLLEAQDLRKQYRLRGGRFGLGGSWLVAVDDVSFALRQGETLGLVGESGAGKSTVGRLVLGLADPTGGSVSFDGTDIGSVRGRQRRAMRRHIQVVFQNPYASLDPTKTIGESVAEPLQVHAKLSKGDERDRVVELLEQVGLGPAYVNRYPHALSGGQRQRVAIARALSLNPRLLVCDEPVSSLDVSTQAQVINLLRDLQRDRGLSYLFVGHDLSVVHQISDRIAVMYQGRIVETGRSDLIYNRPRHPYTQMLLSAVLSIDPQRHRLGSVVSGEHTTDRISTGCPFAARCPAVMERCWTEEPPAVETDGGVTVWCHLPLSRAGAEDSQHSAAIGR